MMSLLVTTYLFRFGFTPLQKCVAGMKMLAYGGQADFLDDMIRMGESTILKCLREFAGTLISVYGAEYLRPPNEQELQHILAMNSTRGFPGMLGSIDCMHWEWRNCPTSWHGMYRGHEGKFTIMLEVVAMQDLRIWHAYFGLPGSHNDINVLHRSPVFDDVANGRAPDVHFTVNGHDYDLGYYLADGMYPDWVTLVKSISFHSAINDRSLPRCKRKLEKMWKEYLVCYVQNFKVLNHQLVCGVKKT